jgi:hypothetical protein
MDSLAGVSGLPSTGAATDSNAEAGFCACPQATQKWLPAIVLLPQFPQNMSRFLVSTPLVIRPMSAQYLPKAMDGH